MITNPFHGCASRNRAEVRLRLDHDYYDAAAHGLFPKNLRNRAAGNKIEAYGSYFWESCAMRWPRRKGKIEELVASHYADLYRYAYRLSGAAPEAEDLTQETFCQAQDKLDQLRDWSKARGWLYSILRNAYLHRLRARKQEHCVSLDSIAEPPESLPEVLPDVEPEKLQQALNDLPEPFRTPIILYYFDDFSYRDIAAHIEVPLGTVMSRLARAKAFLRHRLLQPVSLIAESKEGS
jgi:RNA polymerase sigma-70 factor (ECF subfamily)